MLDTHITGELLAEARGAGAKVVLAGDDRQLASIEHGGLFTVLGEQHGAAEISEITRQHADWQRRAARDLSEGRFADAVAAFDGAGAITWTDDQAAARHALVTAWRRDTTSDPHATRFVFAYTNRDVDALNAELRQVRRERGELAGPEVRFETKHGVADFSPGDRVQFTETDKRAHIYNGNVGTITAIDLMAGVIRARLDAPAGHEGREVAWSALDFAGFRHGYAGTIYKGQGKTLDHTYLYHTHHWRSAASYVALTRQRESAQVFVARKTARDATQLARQMAREELKAASVAWATGDELTPAQRVRHPPEEQVDAASGRQAETPSRQRVMSPLAATVDKQEERVDPEILIPAFVSAAGRDSLGRGLDPVSVAVAVARDRAVQHEREALPHYLRGTYRDPYAAKARLDEMVKRQGWTSTAARMVLDPARLGALRGRVGFFAGTRAKSERAMAERGAAAVAASLERIAAAETRAAGAYRESVEAQRAADATPVPKLSARAEAAVASLALAANEETRAELWIGITADKAMGAELQRFSDAVQRRFGDDTVRALLRSEGRPVEVASVSRQHRAAMAAVGRITHTLKQGEWASASQAEAQRLTQRQALGYRTGLKP
jgi:hypothetical protein